MGRDAQVYKDLDLFFSKKKRHLLIYQKHRESEQSNVARNLILTNTYEKPFHPEIGSGIRELLFEPLSPITAFVLSQKVEDVIENFEPRS